jgi:hypothetical protein
VVGAPVWPRISVSCPRIRLQMEFEYLSPRGEHLMATVAGWHPAPMSASLRVLDVVEGGAGSSVLARRPARADSSSWYVYYRLREGGANGAPGMSRTSGDEKQRQCCGIEKARARRMERQRTVQARSHVARTLGTHTVGARSCVAVAI